MLSKIIQHLNFILINYYDNEAFKNNNCYFYINNYTLNKILAQILLSFKSNLNYILRFQFGYVIG